jgi:hypothetical protein
MYCILELIFKKINLIEEKTELCSEKLLQPLNLKSTKTKTIKN